VRRRLRTPPSRPPREWLRGGYGPRPPTAVRKDGRGAPVPSASVSASRRGRPNGTGSSQGSQSGRDRNDKRAPDPERGTDLRDDQRSGRRNPMGATGTKQGRKGPKRSARREDGEKPYAPASRRLVAPARLAAPVLDKCRRGRNPRRGARPIRRPWRPPPVKLRREEKTTRGWALESRFIGPESPREGLGAQFPEGARAWRTQETDTLLPRRFPIL